MSITFSNNNQLQQTLENIQEFEQSMRSKVKKLDEKTKMQKALRGIKDSKNPKALTKASSSQKSSKGASFLFAMVYALATQMNNNLKSMGAQAGHIQILDKNNESFNKSLEQEQEIAENITNYTDENSLLMSAQISTQMNEIGNEMSTNQQNESVDANAAQAFQTNSKAEGSIGQFLINLEKKIFSQVHFAKG